MTCSASLYKVDLRYNVMFLAKDVLVIDPVQICSVLVKLAFSTDLKDHPHSD